MLSKKAIRSFIASHAAPSVPPGHGLLITSCIDYIVRTGVHTIDRRRTLVLYAYSREDVLRGVAAPALATFMTRDGYVTLAGKTGKWLASAFDRLTADRTCAFCSASDERRVPRFLRDDTGPGLDVLRRAQQAILDARSLARQRDRDRAVAARMAPLRALPRGLSAWVRTAVMPAYFRCAHASSRRPVTGVCTSCMREITLPSASHGKHAVCPRCGRDLIVKSAAKGRHEDRATVQVTERVDGGTAVIRIVKAEYIYQKDALLPLVFMHENARVFVSASTGGRPPAEPYYLSYGPPDGRLTPWRRGFRPVYFKYQYNFDADICGVPYTRNLPDALRNTPWEYCPLSLFASRWPGEPMELAPFLAAHADHPHLEKLIKTGFYSLASDLAYGRVPDGLLDGAQCRTHRILRVDAADVAFLRDLDPDAGVLRTFQGYAGLKDRRELLSWQLRNKITRDVPELLSRGATPHKLMRYAESQFALLSGASLPYGGTRYNSMQSVLSEWRDYADMAGKIARGDNILLYPRNLMRSHDDVQARLKAERDAAVREGFVAAMAGVADRLRYERDGYLVAVPSVPDDLTAEGRALHTCVGGYVGRVAEGGCVILFVRAVSSPDVPLCTMEIRDNRVVQLRGEHNQDAPPDVRRFVDEYERRVLSRMAA